MCALVTGVQTCALPFCYLARVDHAKALKFIANWPASSPIYHAACFCEQFTYLDQEFGYDCVEALAPAIAGRLRADPIDAIAQLADIFGSALRVFAHVGVYRGTWAPTARPRATPTQPCSVWYPQAIAAKLSQPTP